MKKNLVGDKVNTFVSLREKNDSLYQDLHTALLTPKNEEIVKFIVSVKSDIDETYKQTISAFIDLNKSLGFPFGKKPIHKYAVKGAVEREFKLMHNLIKEKGLL